MKKLLSGITSLTTYGYIAFALIIWVVDYFKVDIQPILDALGLEADFFGATGLVVGAGKTLQVVIRWVLTKFETRNAALYSTFLTGMISVQKALNEVQSVANISDTRTLKAIELSNKSIEFMMILANKNLESKILDDDVKETIRLWKESVTSVRGDFIETV